MKDTKEQREKEKEGKQESAGVKFSRWFIIKHRQFST